MYKVRKTEYYDELETICNEMYTSGYILDQFQHKGSGIYVLIFRSINYDTLLHQMR